MIQLFRKYGRLPLPQRLPVLRSTAEGGRAGRSVKKVFIYTRPFPKKQNTYQ